MVSSIETAHDTVIPNVILFLVIAVSSPDKATTRSYVFVSRATCLANLITSLWSDGRVFKICQIESI